MPDPEKKKASINIAGPAELGSDLLSPRTLTEAIPAGVKAGGSSLLGGLLNFPELVSNTPVLNRLPMAGPIALTQDPAEFSLPEPLQKFKDFLKSSEAANNYTKKYYDGESLASLFGKLAKSGSVEDLKRFTDYTANKVAEQIPSQIGLYASAMAGVPAPLALSIIGASSAGNKYQEDNEQYPELKPEDRLIRAYSSGALEAGTEGLSYGVKGAAMAGKSALEAIPGVKSILAGEMGQSLKGVFSGLSKAVGATPARKVMSNILFNMFGEGSEEVVNEAANMWMDEHYKVKQYEFKDYLNRAIEAFGISAIASGILSSPGSAIGELSDRREYANAGNRQARPQFEELVATSHMIDVYNKGLDGSTNPDNQPRIVSGELILLQELADDMLKNGEWNDSEGSGALELMGNSVKESLSNYSKNPSKNMDLFGIIESEEKVAYGGKGNAEKAIREISSREREIKVVSPKESTPIWESAFALILKKTGSLSFPKRRITSPADIAFAFQSLKNESQEHAFIGAVKNGYVVGVELLHIGAIDESIVSIYEMIPILHSHDADSYFLVHNHPSGRVDPSTADIEITQRSKTALGQLGINFVGHVIINDSEFGFIGENYIPQKFKHAQYAATKNVNVFKKYNEWKSTKESRARISAPEDVYEIIKGVQKNDERAIIFLLDKGNRIQNLMVTPMPSVNVSTIGRMAAASRSTGVIISGSNLNPAELRKLSDNLSKLSIRLLDSVDMVSGNYRSSREMGILGESEDIYGGRRYSSWLSKVKKEGGLDPSSLEDLGYNLKELREFGLGGIIKKGGLKVDSYAEELTGLGLLKPAGNETPSDALIRTLKQKAKITNESANAWERQYEKEYSEWLKKQSESGADEADIRRAEKELEADLEKEDHSQEIEGGAGGGIDFNFGSNAKTPPPVSQSASTSQPVPPLSQRQDNYEGLYQKYINRMQSIENLSERAKAQGLTIRPGEDPKLRARSYLGIGKKVESILEDKTFYVKPDGTFEITGEGLKPILEFYDKNSPEKNFKQRDQDLRDYLISTRYLEDLDRPKKPGSNETIATPAQLTKAANDILRINKKYGKDISFLKGTAKRIYAYQRRVLETLVHSGNMSREKFDSIIATNPHYVPFDRIIEDADPFTAGVPKSSNRFSGARSPVKKIKGSEKEIFDPIESIVKNTYRIIDAADRNSVAASVAKLAAKFPDDISPVKIDMIPINLTESEGGGEEKTIFRPSQFAPKGRVIEYFEDGKRKYIEVSKNLYDAMKGLNEDGVGLLTKIFSIPATLLRKGATLTPEFMFRNPIRDQFTAFMNDPNTPKNVKSILGVLIQGKKTIGSMGDILKKDSTYYDWLRSGGAYSGFVEIDRKNLKKHVENLLKRPDILGKLNIIAHAESLSQFFEQATRIGVFKSATEKGMSPMEAGFLSREATIDFARRGSQTKDVNAAIAFFNAGLQGVDKSFRAMQKDPAGFIAKGIAAITIPSIAFSLLNWDDPEYDEIPRWQKDLFWVFKARGTWWRIPKPFLFGQIFGTVPERLIEKAFKNKPLEGKKLIAAVYKSISPIGDDISGLLATGIKPILENQANWNYFLDRPIVPQSRENLLPAQQYTRGTTETAKKIGSVLNYSPAKIENTVQGWLGGSGKYLLQAGDEVLVAAKKMRGEAVNRKPLELTDIPLIKGFSVNTHSPESVNRFYENKKKVDAAYLSLSKVLGEGKTEEAKKILKSNPQVKAYLLFSKLSDAIREIDSAIESIGKSSLPDQDKRQRIKKAEGFKLAIAKKGNSVIDRIQ